MVDRIGAQLPPAAPEPSKILPGTVWGDLVDTIDDLKNQKDKVLRVTINAPVGRLRDELDSLSEEQSKALQEAVSASKSLSNWSLGALIASILYATSSIMGGYYLKSCGRPEGDQFIYSGAMLLANAAATHLNGWGRLSSMLSFGNQTVEQILTTILPVAVTLYAYAWNNRNLAQLSDDHKKKIESMTNLFTIVSGAMQVGKIYLKFKQAQADMQLQYLDSEMNSKNLKVNQLLMRRGWIQDSFDSISSGLRRVIKNMFYTTADFAKNN